MAKLDNKSIVNQIFEDLENYRIFCRDYGYRYDERDLYNNKSYIYRQYQKTVASKPAKNQWEIDAEKFKERELLNTRR
jgi:hypothetical protein